MGARRFDLAGNLLTRINRDVMFTYPASKSNRPAINGVSFSIKPGQLVVIVGSNGSGKTSLVKLLTRLYDPTSGAILVDGRPVSSFQLGSLRDATALLSQDHTLFPFSILENISLGRPDAELDETKVREAAVKGGAAGFVERLEGKYETVLQPIRTKSSIGLGANHPLMKELDEMERKTDVSGEFVVSTLRAVRSFCIAGGERQRLVAYVPFRNAAPRQIADRFHQDHERSCASHQTRSSSLWWMSQARQWTPRESSSFSSTFAKRGRGRR